MSTILILGATSAVAGRIAELYAETSTSGASKKEQSHQIYLIGRREDVIQAVSQRLGETVVGTDSVDFVDLPATELCIRKAYEVMGSFDYVLIAHGVIGDQILSEASVEEALTVIEVNYTSVVAQLVTLTALMANQSAGKIGVITSVAGDRGRPRNYTYGAAKGALNIYLQGLRSVRWGSGLEVYTFKLGPVDSPMTVDHEKNFSFSTIDTVAEKIVQAFESRRYVHYIPGYWWFVMWVVRWLPEPVFQKLGFLSDR